LLNIGELRQIAENGVVSRIRGREVEIRCPNQASYQA